MQFDKELDARGLNCPLPILRTKKFLSELNSGQVLKVSSTDPGSVKDMQAFAKQTGNELLSTAEKGGVHFPDAQKLNPSSTDQEMHHGIQKMALIATKGAGLGLSPFILASTAAAWVVKYRFSSFYGLQLLKKVVPSQGQSTGQSGHADGEIGSRNRWNVPVPGYVATAVMKRTISNTGVASIPDLRGLCQEADVKMIACQMTVELFNLDHGDFIDGLEYGGAATFFEFAGETDICLFI